MNASQPVRIITFIVFLTLIGGFVAYRAGAFESTDDLTENLPGTIEEATTPASTQAAQPESDTPAKVEGFIVPKKEMIYSSKSIVLPKGQRNIILDKLVGDDTQKSGLNKEAIESTLAEKKQRDRNMLLMAGSKSMVIRPMFQDTTKKKTDSVVKKKQLMYSSKVGYIYEPTTADTPKTTTTKEPEKKPMMGGSKSAIIFEPKPKADTAKKPKK